MRVTGQMFGVNNSFWDCVNSKNVFVWGGNITEALIQTWHWIAEARDNGAKIICIDPRYSISASKSDIFVPLKPGTDSPLVLAMINHIIDRDLCDKEYLRNHTVAPYLVRNDTGAILRMSDLGVAPTEGPVNASTGKPTIIDPAVVWDEETSTGVSENESKSPVLTGTYEVANIEVSTAFDKLKAHVAEHTPEWAAEITGLEASVIKELAETFADGPSSVLTCYGFDRYDNGDIVGHAIATLSAITGNLGVTGGGFGLPGTAKGLMLVTDTAWSMPDPSKKASMIPWLSVPEIVRTGKYGDKPYQLKALLNVSGNAFGNHAQQKEFIEETLSLIDFVVTHDSRMTDTCRYSDIVLPACHWWETDNLSTSTWLQINEKAIEPLYESKCNVEFLSLLATAMGFGDYFTMTAQEAVKSAVDNSAALKAAGITYDRLLKEKSIFNVREQYYDGVAIRDFKFPSPSGRLEFYQEKPMPRMNYGQEYDAASYRLPEYSHPIEAWDGNPLREKYPLIAFQEHSRWRVHSAFGDLPWLRELDPEPTVRLSPTDAEKRGIVAGDIVRAYNDRGSVVLKALVDASLPEGMCNIPKGWEKYQCIEGCYQELTSNRINPVNLNQSYNDTLVEIQKEG